MKIDIAICTFNRADLLAHTLHSIAAADLPPESEVRVIVVANNCTDHTADVVAGFDSLPAILVQESQQGHCYARNRAIQSAQGDLILWTDDDVIVDRNWIVSYVRAAVEYPHEDFWGGVIAPVFRPEAAAWIVENMDSLSGCFAARDLGRRRLEFTPARLPYGANFAMRTEVQKKFPFNTKLGRDEYGVLGEDEIDLLTRMIAAGHAGSWVPECHVQHVITADRQTESYVRQYFIGQGRALLRKGELWNSSLLRMRLSEMYENAAYRLKRPFVSSPAWVAHLIRSGLARGQRISLSERKSSTDRRRSHDRPSSR